MSWDSLPAWISHSVQDLQIAAGAKRDDDAVGRQVQFLELGRVEMAFHAVAILQRPVPIAFCFEHARSTRSPK
jgi:hypothetical protein